MAEHNFDGHNFHPSVLREYDIRGIVGKTLSIEDARAIGRAFGTIVGAQAPHKGGRCRVALGYDGRHSSPGLADGVAAGLMAAGIDVYRIGRGPTPMLYYAVHEFDADGGIQITGSHNPPDYNGFKLMLGKRGFFGADIQELGRLAASGAYATGTGRSEERPVADRYIERLVRDFPAGRPLAVAWDAGNGAAGEIMAEVTKRLPGRHILMYETIDGDFPNHHPDPTVAENLEDIIATVRRNKLDLGVAFDGDGDRIGVVDGKGRIIWADQLMMILAADVLKERPGATIIADVKSSQALFEEIARHGGKPLMWKTGHSLIKSKMAELMAPFGGEMSGHIFFADRWYGFDDALYVALRLLSILTRSAKSLAEIRDGLPQSINTPELRFPCAEERKFKAVAEIAARLKAVGTDMSDIDGVRVNTADGWWLLRASNTQDVLVARCESSSEAGLERLKGALVAELTRSGVAAPKF
jgi:phosphomannomutase